MQQRPRWRGASSAAPRRVPSKYKVTLHHNSTDSTLKLPYAPRKYQSSTTTTSNGVSSSTKKAVMAYDSLNDPHLTRYYTKKFATLAGKEMKEKRRRPASAMASLSGSTRSGRLAGNVPFEVIVRTGDVHGSGTDARVYVTVQGTTGKICKTHLSSVYRQESLNGDEQATRSVRFPRNSSERFLIRGPEIGEPVQIRIEHDGLEERQSWFLDEVELVNVTSNKAWRFPCRQWISLYKTDCQLARNLVPLASSVKPSKLRWNPAFQKEDKRLVYDISVLTGDVRGAGTDANVFLTVFGERGSTPKTKLSNGQTGNFSRGKDASFRMRCANLGEIHKIRIEHDNTGFGAGWFVEKIVVSTQDDDNVRRYYFHSGQWLARDEGDGQIRRDIAASNDPIVVSASSKPLRYVVSTYTGSVRGAGTDANVFVTIFGSNGDTGDRRLDNNKNNFERNRVDQFAVESPSLGVLERIRISHDNAGLGPGWYLEKVTVEDPSDNQVYNFPCSQWLAKDEGDGRISRELKAIDESKTNGSDTNQAEAGVLYHVSVVTGDKRNAGTDAKVYVILHGCHKDSGLETNSGKIWLDKKGSKFRRARTNTFDVETVESLSPLSKLTVGHDNSGLGAGWLLEKIIVDCPSSGHRQVFPCNAWLEKDLIERELYEEEEEHQQATPKNVWSVCIWTSDVRGSGTDASVSLQIYGDKGKSDVITLQNEDDNFEQGEVDKFKLESPDIGQPYKIRIEHDNSGPFPGWQLDKIQLQNTSTKERFLFPCGRWLDRKKEDGEIVRELPVCAIEGEGEQSVSPLAIVIYNVSVFTGKTSGAGTDANVFLQIFGERGDTGARTLRTSKTNKNKFENGKCDEFSIEAVSLGTIDKIRIGHDDTGPGAGWFLDRVVIQSDDEKLYTFHCQRWLSTSEDDGQIVRDLFISQSVEASLLKTTSYHIAVETGDCRNAGTDANVFVCLWGSDGDMGRRPLKYAASDPRHRNKFERGHIDKFTFESADIGDVERLLIGHDGTGPGSGWYVSRVTVDVVSSSSDACQKYVFPCNRWLAKSEGDGKLEVELLPQTQLESVGEKKIAYQVTVETGDVQGAGTDANVFLVLYGDEGKSDQVSLKDRGKSNFKRAQVDTFKIEANDVGKELTKIRIGHDGKGIGSGWFLTKVVVTRREDDDDSSWTFPCSRWLARGEDDGEIVRELVPSTSETASASLQQYTVQVATGDVSGAGTDSNVYLTIYGDEGDTGERHLRSSQVHVNKFERANVDVFRIDAVPLGRLKKVKVRHDDSGPGSDWYLDRVEISTHESESAVVFPCQQWLARNRGDGLIARELMRQTKTGEEIVVVDESLAQTPGLLNPAEADAVEVTATPDSLKRKARESTAFLEKECVSYRLSVVTGSVSGAGTDANVFVVLYGEKDDTGVIPLTKSETHRNKFEQGQTDEFVLEAIDIGKIRKLKIRHDNGGGALSGWFLEKVVVDSPVLGIRQTFSCERWLDKNKDDGLLERELFPVDDSSYDPHVRYEVTTYTSDVRGAGTDATVSVVIYGETKQTEPMVLFDKRRSTRKDCFERSSVDVCLVEGVDVGAPIKKIRIGHDGKGFGAGWHLDKVEVRKKIFSQDDSDDASCTTILYTFPCGRWLATSEDDGTIVRELVPSLETVVKRDEASDTGTVNVLSLKRKETLDVVHYRVSVFTGDVRGAGTDSNVFLTLYGEEGDSGERKLQKSQTHMNKFERGQEDVFRIEAANLGRLEKIKIRHDSSSLKKSWHLDRIVVAKQKTANDDVNSDDEEEYVFFCKKWLAKDKEDGMIERILTAGEPDSVIRYQVEIVTGDVRHAGTDANVFVTISGEKGDTGRRPLTQRFRNLFERNQTDVFVIEASDLGTLTALTIEHDNKGFGSGWLLDRVIVTDEKRNVRVEFPCGKWLDKKKDDGQICRTLLPTPATDNAK
ncbi:lipoxygenase homology domain-containing protein 1-like [Oscarella lobularis]|uniref:lipoxygenase homology domain-containing protein 1-like n=1 Tax=Oscarella lobularis TaxID=121494 RepID=UPI003313E552